LPDTYEYHVQGLAVAALLIDQALVNLLPLAPAPRSHARSEPLAITGRHAGRVRLERSGLAFVGEFAYLFRVHIGL